MADQTKVPNPIAWSVILLFLLSIAVWYFYGNSQHANLKRIEKWVETIEPEFEDLKKERPGLEAVSISAYTGGNGMVFIYGPPLDPADEVAVYRFVFSMYPPRPVRIAIKSRREGTAGLPAESTPIAR